MHQKAVRYDLHDKLEREDIEVHPLAFLPQERKGAMSEDHATHMAATHAGTEGGDISQAHIDEPLFPRSRRIERRFPRHRRTITHYGDEDDGIKRLGFHDVDC